MNYRGVLLLLGRLLLVLGVALLIPAGVAVYLGDGTAMAFFLAAAIAGVSGLLMGRLFRDDIHGSFGRREAFVLVSATWVMAALVGAMPYAFIKGPDFIVDALFESTSGFTTTGASILDDIEAESSALLLWRSLTQWFGGMGIIVLGIAILPKLAIGGMELLGAEAPGPMAQKLTPRIARTAEAMWGIYAGLTALLFLILRLFGMGTFDALNHALTTMSTAGFSTRNDSVGAYGSAIQIVILVFMLIAGMNFALHFNLLRGKPISKLLRDSELRFYVGVLILATALITGDLLIQSDYDLQSALRLGAFQSATILTTTGYVTADYDSWPNLSRVVLFVLMFVGGCNGSTSGSIKVVRVLILLKSLGVGVKRIVKPRAVLPVRLGRRAIPDDVVSTVTNFVLLFVVLFAVGGLLLSLLGLDPLTAFAASATCLANVGPGLGEVGPGHSLSDLPTLAKLLLVTMMIIGRLELYTVLVALFLFGEGLSRVVVSLPSSERNGGHGPGR